MLHNVSMLNPHVPLKGVQLEEREVLAEMALELHIASDFNWMILVYVSFQMQNFLELLLFRAGIAEEGGICRHVLDSWSDHLLLKSSSNLDPVARILLTICVLLCPVGVVLGLLMMELA